MHRIKTKGEVLAAWCEATTVHGVADLYRAKQFSCGEVVFWVFVVFSAFSFAAWQIQGVINSYITGSGYSVNILYNREFPLTFPSIVICNVNRATKTAARELNITSPKVLELFFGHFYSSSIFSLTTNYSKFEPYWKDFLTQHPQYNGRPDLLMTKLAHTCENMIQYMKANDSNVLIGKNCCAPAITNPVRNTYGICNYINVDMFKQLYAGPEFGLRFLGNVESNEYMSDVYWNYDLGEGLVAFMTSNPYEPAPVRPFLLRKGSHTMIEITQQKTRFAPPSQFKVFPLPCSYALEYQSLKGLYTTDTCVIDCTITAIRNVCNCTPVNVEIRNDSKSLPWCDYFAKECWDYSARTQWVRKCIDGCASPCEERVSYSASITTHDFPSQNSKDKLIEFVNTEFKLELNLSAADSVLVDIFYSQLSQMVVETAETTPLFSFISNIGGQLGLWMGASMVSVVQAVHYFFTMCRAKCRRPKVSVGSGNK